MENKKLCSICKGTCCKNCGCELSPSDFKNGVTYEAIKEKIDEGLLSIDWWDGNVFDEDMEDSRYGADIHKCLFLRMRNKNAPIVDPTFSGGECVALTENGCKLSYDERPKGGRELIPNLKFHDDTFDIRCDGDWSKKESAIEWFEYRELLHKLMIEYYNPFENALLVELAKAKNITKENWRDKRDETTMFDLIVNEYLKI